MKQGLLVTTQNVIEANRCIANLRRRPKLEMVGLGLVYGAPGLGKTTWATRVAFQSGHIYIRLDATTTPKTFAITLLRSIHNYLGNADVPIIGSTADIYSRSVSLLAVNPDAVIIIDEIDYAYRNPKLLGVIRDIVDETLAIVILVGMENAMERLLQINRYYFDRCSQFYQFVPASIGDLADIADAILEVPITPEVVDYVHRLTKGNLRQAINVMDYVESLAKRKKLQKVTIHDLEADR